MLRRDRVERASMVRESDFKLDGDGRFSGAPTGCAKRDEGRAHVTMILIWNPSRWDFDPGEYERNIELTSRDKPVPVRAGWSAGRRRHGVAIGQRAFLLRQGADRRGIVASGVIESEPYPAPHWDGTGREAWFVDVLWDRFVEVDDRIPTDVLIEQVPAVPWNYLFSSGNEVSDPDREQIENLWSGSLPTGRDATEGQAGSDSSPSSFPAEVHGDALGLLRRLIGVPISTVRGQRNIVLGVRPPTVLVGTEKSGDGRPVPIQQVQEALDTLRADGSVTIDPEHLGYRSSFIGAVLLTLPGARTYGSPPIFTLTGFGSSERPDSGDHVITFEGDLNHQRQVEQRGEQAMLRRTLFGSQDEGTCALCGERYPVRFLYAAHIKRRSVCTEAEKRDLASIAMPACAFGCDALFESGYISVDSAGTVVASKDAVDGHAGDYAMRLESRACPAFHAGSKQYFEWHQSNIYRG